MNGIVWQQITGMYSLHNILDSSVITEACLPNIGLFHVGLNLTTTWVSAHPHVLYQWIKVWACVNANYYSSNTAYLNAPSSGSTFKNNLEMLYQTYYRICLIYMYMTCSASKSRIYRQSAQRLLWSILDVLQSHFWFWLYIAISRLENTSRINEY